MALHLETFNLDTWNTMGLPLSRQQSIVREQQGAFVLLESAAWSRKGQLRPRSLIVE